MRRATTALGGAQKAIVRVKDVISPRHRPEELDIDLPHVVIIGGGFGGLNVAKGLRDAPVRVTLVDQHNYHVFQPLLYQVATASLSPADIASPIRSILRKNLNTQVVLARAESVDPERCRVWLDSGDDIEYDFLVLATGVQPAYFGHPEWARLAPGLKDIDDAVEIRSRIFQAFEKAERATIEGDRRRALTIAIVGGGPTGVELAGAVAEIAHHTLTQDFRAIDPSETRVILISSGDRILKDFPVKLSDRANRDLQRLGVEVRNGSRVTDILPGELRLGDEAIDADTVIWAAGVSTSPLAQSLGVSQDRIGRIAVGPDMTIPEHPEIFVIGDLAAASDKHGEPLPGVAPVAIQAAALTADNIQRRLANEPSLSFTYQDKGIMATVGRGRAVAVIAGRTFDGLVAWSLWAVVHIWSLIEFRSRLTVVLQWAWLYLTQQRSARLIVASRPGKSDEQSPDSST